jgi:hypothetical protein
MDSFSNRADAIEWLTQGANRVLIMRSQDCSHCEDFYNNQLLEWSKTKVHHEFAYIFESNFDKNPNDYSWPDRWIIPMGAPVTLEQLNNKIG